MKQLLIIPDRNNREKTIELAEQYKVGFEYNDFFKPELLEDEAALEEVIAKYQRLTLPEYSTVHGAFFDVIPFSLDEEIRKISIKRIKQSIEVAKRIGAKAVIFHTNYNPFLNTDTYIARWLEENVDFWSYILEQYSDIQIYLENMFDTTPDVIESLSKVLCQYDNYGVCLDYAHAAISKVPPEIWAERLGKYVKHVHINDNDLISDLHLPWGEGKIDRAAFYYSYDKYLADATVLVETTSLEQTEQSIKTLIAEGFWE